MGFLYALESIRVPVLNEIMLGITYLGDETAFLIVALILVWCADKRTGYYILSVGFLGTITSQFLKLCFRIPRPWVVDENFTILEQAREGASGYSFPSGHSQSSVGTFGAIAYTTKNKILRWVCVAVCVLVPFSRMYVGVHTPLDVGVGVLIALVFIFALKPVILGKNKNALPIFMGAMLVLAVAYLCFVELYPFPEITDEHGIASFESGRKNAYTLLGALVGLIVVYIVDEKWLHFPTKAVWWAQIIKVAAGLAIALAVKEGLRAPVEGLLGPSAGRAVRYFLLVAVAGCLWPLTFKWFSKLGTKET